MRNGAVTEFLMQLMYSKQLVGFSLVWRKTLVFNLVFDPFRPARTLAGRIGKPKSFVGKEA
jgi:hypothetical protein